MKSYSTEKIRNLALVGHSSSGKTSVCEALLFKSGVTNRLGKVDDGNTVTDFEKEEISRKVSISTATAVTSWKDFKINLIDTPGYFDFSGEVYSALRASEAALVVLDAQNSIEVGAEKVLKYTESIELPRIIFVNKMDKENVNFAKVVSDLHIKFGKKVIPFTLALGEGENFKGIIDVLNKKAYEYKGFERVEVPIPEIRIEEVNHVYDTIVEVVAETDDELMEKFFNEEEFSHEEFLKGVTSALLNGSAVPLICGSATTGAGIDMLLDVITDYMPAPDDKRAKRGFRNEDENVRKISKDEPFSAVVFKTIVDPFIGRISIFKVISGKIDKDTVVYNSTKGQEEKIGSLFYLNGKTQIETKEIIAGDIGAISKLTIDRKSVV